MVEGPKCHALVGCKCITNIRYHITNNKQVGITKGARRVKYLTLKFKVLQMASSQSNNKKDLAEENEPKFNKFCKVIDLFTLVYNDITQQLIIGLQCS